jgi:tetratricopeptide (TPR) repeat protein
MASDYNNRGITYTDLQQCEAALPDYGRAIALDPNFAPAYYNRGNTYHDLQQYEVALADYGRAIALVPDLAQAHHNRGTTYAALQQYEAALADFGHAIVLNPNYAQAYFNLGALFATTGRSRESLPYFEKAAQLGDLQATQAISKIKQMLGMEPTPQIDPAQQAFAAFQQAGSVEAMQQAVARFPLLAQADFIVTIEQVITQQVPPEQRLAWLRQIINE